MPHYENIYKDSDGFSFGKNWKNFLVALTPQRETIAQESLVDFFGGKEHIEGKTFVDIGCGSGLFSLAAYRLGAKRVVNVDPDEFSIACAQYLREEAGKPANWQVVKGSILDNKFIESLGQFDLVYSWGVLHHTGDMHAAFDNITQLMRSDARFYLAIYNHSRIPWIGTSEFWLKTKKLYNHSGTFGKKIIYALYGFYFFIDSLVAGKNPLKRLQSFKRRGMDWHHNVIDWLGGYPYEFASPEDIINYFSPKNIYCEKIANGYGLGCVEYLLRKLR